ncbi:hypothetical protein [Streptomyces sp. NBC_01353]|uniref:hypothetical protein n=1 Tax=Streptomyces sp. NBC_01353 TaxID=2903835 RepID=UPI002E35D042|nr:hypothetical protein [Streptomyces sp. NBC_01353]
MPGRDRAPAAHPRRTRLLPGGGTATRAVPLRRLPAQLDYRFLGIADDGDFLAASLNGAAARLADVRGVGGQLGVLADLAEAFVDELRALREPCRAIPPGATALADPAWCVLSDRYALVLAAAAILATWEGQDGSEPFLAAPAWAVLALTLGGRLGIPLPDLPEDCRAQVLDELVRRYRAGRSCDLDATELAQ